LRVVFDADAFAPGLPPHLPQGLGHVRDADRSNGAGGAIDQEKGNRVGFVPPINPVLPLDGLVAGRVENELVDERRRLKANESHDHGFALVDDIPGQDLGFP